MLADRSVYAYEMSGALHEMSHATITANEQSIYRALTRFEGLGLVTSAMHPSQIGPPRKYYHLSPKGLHLLGRFIQRNLQVFHEPQMIARLQELAARVPSEEEIT